MLPLANHDHTMLVGCEKLSIYLGVIADKSKLTDKPAKMSTSSGFETGYIALLYKAPWSEMTILVPSRRLSINVTVSQ